MRRGTPKLGQHFLRDATPARLLASAARAGAGEIVLEIGPGKGALTKEILATGASVVAVEKDAELVTYLTRAFANDIAKGQLRLMEADIRDVSPESMALGVPYVLAANIPYYMTGEIVRTFLTAREQPTRMALLVQKEVAERVVARDGKESILSLSVKAYGTPRIVANVPRGHFAPPPSVDSAILLIDDISRAFFSDVTEEQFFRTVRAGFASKRKRLVSNLGAAYGKKQARTACSSCGIHENVRAEDVRLEQWKLLATELGPRTGA
jgi:16S rRNA (adenine1518-N6/adenine1519-N6)-dimethyltransferase